ncbi:unnamed protein product [Cladocopium goreaui]|uniref:Retrovirus-related Pol polyprotein from transposon TNT 1-94 n=1 Tax=Cladocopium goreaui TaxID=2562237 RepID=A0A9P1GA95_9DINO|nr:unnamed protein product [Cladocopium goreaui]
MKKKTDLEKSPQKKKGLEKPSNQRTIKDKVKAAAEEAEGDADQGAAILHGSLSKLDKSKGTRYTPEELEMHLQSGKVIWRECPYTSGTFEYKDIQNWHKAINTARQKEWQSGVEFEPEDEDLEKFMELFSTDCHSLSVDEGLGKGSAKGLGKGQGSLGKGRRGRGRAIKEEEDKDEPDPHEKLAKACRTARNMVSATLSDLEEALEKAGSKLTKAGKTTANDLSKELGKALQKIKTLLTGKSKLQDDPVKGQLMEVAQVVKTAKDETKKLLALGGASSSSKAK